MRTILIFLIIPISLGLSAQTNPDEDLIKAATSGSVSQIKNALAQGANVDAVNENGESALYITVDKNRKSQFDLLLKSGADVNKADASGKHIIVNAIDKVRYTMVKPLLDKGISPETQAPDGKPLLVLATERYAERSNKPRLSMVENLLNAGANPNAIAASGDTILQEFTKKGWSSLVSLALTKGGELNIRDKRNNLLIHLATESGSTKTLDVVLGKGQHINWDGERKMTPLMIAAEKNNLSMVRHILKKRPDVNLKNDRGDTALSFAVQNQNLTMIKSLLQAGASSGIRNAYGNPLLMEVCGVGPQATNSNTFKIMSLLASGRGAINVTNRYGNNCLSYAITQKNVKMIEYLIKKGADPNAKDSSGNSSLHKAVLAAVYGRLKNESLTDTMETLLENGARTDTTDNKGQTALHYAATPMSNRDSVGGIQAMEILMNYSADPYAKDSAGKTPADYSQGYGEYKEFMSRYTTKTDLRVLESKNVIYATQSRNGEIYIISKDETDTRKLTIYTARGLMMDSFDIKDGDFVQSDANGNIWTIGVAPGEINGKPDSRCKKGQNLVVSIRKYNQGWQEIFHTTEGMSGSCAGTSVIDLKPSPVGSNLYAGVIFKKKQRNLIYINSEENKVSIIAKPSGSWNKLSVNNSGNAVILTTTYSEYNPEGKRITVTSPTKLPGRKQFYVSPEGNFYYSGDRKSSRMKDVVWVRGYNKNSTLRWRKVFASTASDEVNYLFVDPSDNVYMIVVSSADQFHGHRNPEKKSVPYLVKLNPDGSRAFTTKIPSDFKRSDSWNIGIGSSTIIWKDGGTQVYQISEGLSGGILNIIPGF